VALVAALALPAPALGHASFESSRPAPGARVARSPGRIVLHFSETLDRRLSTVTVQSAEGARASGRARFASATTMVFVPRTALARGVYAVRWHTVALDDGHALDGEVGFAVGQRFAGAASSGVGGGPGTVPRVITQAVLYAALMIFSGAGILDLVLARWRRAGAQQAGSWLIPVAAAPGDAQILRARQRTLVRGAGWAAMTACASTALLLAGEAAPSLTQAAGYLTHNRVGLAYIVLTGLLAAGAHGVHRDRRWWAPVAALGPLPIALSGHAAASAVAPLAIAIDGLHLTSVSVWVSGIVLIAWALRGGLRPATRGAFVAEVLPRFSLMAASSAAMAVFTGILSALLELDAPSDLWATSYGRALSVKGLLVLVVVGLSAWHVVSLRPAAVRGRRRALAKLLRVLAAQPLLLGAVAVCAAVLVAVPLPPRQQAQAAAGVAGHHAPSACEPCPVPRPAASELSVATRAGRDLVAGWLRAAGRRVTGTLRVYDIHGRPAGARVSVPGARTTSCGPACLTVDAPGHRWITVAVADGPATRAVRLTAAWRPRRTAEAARLLATAQRAMRRVRTAREVDITTSGPGTHAVTHYVVQAPNRLSADTLGENRMVVVGRTTWIRTAGHPWARTAVRAAVPFDSRTFFEIRPAGEIVRLLARGPHEATLALMDPGSPAWSRVRLSLHPIRVREVYTATPGQFLSQRIFAVDRPAVVAAPRRLPGYAPSTTIRRTYGP
jgi:copper transport protein